MDSKLSQFNWAEMMEEDVGIKVASTPKSQKLDLISNRIKVVVMSRKKYDVESRRKKIIEEMNQWYNETAHKIMFNHCKGSLEERPSKYNGTEVDTSPGSLAVLHDYYRYGCHTDQKFFRVQIQRPILEGSSPNMMMDTFEGLLIDVGEIVRFCKHELYPMEPKFMPMPPQVFPIKLAGLDAFENTGRLGKVLESILIHFGKDYIMKVKKAATETTPPEVDLIKEGLGVTLNDYIVMLCSTQESGEVRDKTEGDKIEGCYINTIFPGGRIGVKLGSQALKAVMKALEDAEARYEDLKLKKPSEELRKKGDKFVARHAETSKLERCKLLEDLGPEEEEAKVEWMDFGGQSNIMGTELVKAEVLSPVLEMAPATYFVFRLQNVFAVRAAPERLNTLVRSATKPFTLSVTDVYLSGPPKVLVYNEGAEGELEIFNQMLIDRQLAMPSDGRLDWTIPDPKILLSQLIWTMPMDLVSAEWTPLSKENPLKTLKVEPGQRVTIDIPFEDGQFVHCQKFRIRPVVTRAKFEKLQREIFEYCVESSVVSDERNNPMLGLCEGEFCFVEIVEGEFWRAQIRKRIDQGFMQANWKKQLYELVVLDSGNVQSILGKFIMQVRNPWSLLSHLGPQVALGEWKVANNFIASMDGSPDERQKELSNTLQEKLGNGKNVSAIVSKIRKDEYGRNVLELAFDFDQEVESRLMLNSFSIV